MCCSLTRETYHKIRIHKVTLRTWKNSALFHTALIPQQQSVESAFVPFPCIFAAVYTDLFLSSPFLCCVPDKTLLLIRKYAKLA